MDREAAIIGIPAIIIGLFIAGFFIDAFITGMVLIGVVVAAATIAVSAYLIIKHLDKQEAINKRLAIEFCQQHEISPDITKRSIFNVIEANESYKELFNQYKKDNFERVKELYEQTKNLKIFENNYIHSTNFYMNHQLLKDLKKEINFDSKQYIHENIKELFKVIKDIRSETLEGSNKAIADIIKYVDNYAKQSSKPIDMPSLVNILKIYQHHLSNNQLTDNGLTFNQMLVQNLYKLYITNTDLDMNNKVKLGNLYSKLISEKTSMENDSLKVEELKQKFISSSLDAGIMRKAQESVSPETEVLAIDNKPDPKNHTDNLSQKSSDNTDRGM